MFSVENHSHPADLNSDRATSGIAACTISVIIPNLNGLSYLSSCLKSVFAQEIPGYALEVFVIDNCSTDGSLDAVHEQFPQVEVIANAENRGFTQAINQGIEASRGEYLLLLNNDVVVCSGALLMLTTELRDGPADLAGVQPLMLSAQDTSVVDSAGISLLPHFQACDFLHGHALAEASEEKQEIWGTCFGCALIKRSVFHQCGHLDPDFFAEWDDVDFSLRARWHGWRFLLVPAARVLHHRSPTSMREPELKFIRRRRNQVLTYAKSLPLWMAIRLTLYRLQRDFFSVIHFIRHRQLGAMIRSWTEYFALLCRMIVRRRQLRSSVQLSSSQLIQQIRQFTDRTPQSAKPPSDIAVAGDERKVSKPRPFVLFMPAGGLENSSARTRIYAYLPLLKQYGFRCHIASYTYHKYNAATMRGKRAQEASQSPNFLLKKLWLELLPLRNLWALLRADTIVFEKKQFRGWEVKLGRFLGKRIVYDLDDAIYLRPPDLTEPSNEQALQTDAHFASRLSWMLERADLTIVATEELARFVSERSRKVTILPSVVSEVLDRPSVPNANPVIGWVGAPENQRYLRDIENVLVRLTSERRELEIWILTSHLMNPPPRFRYRFIPWNLSAENQIISRFTAGIAPLRDDAWCNAKMNFKALVYMSSGVPAVASPADFLSQEFEDGRSVLLARTEEEWYRHLNTLLDDPARRDEVAATALDIVRERFWAPARVAEFAAALRG